MLNKILFLTLFLQIVAFADNFAITNFKAAEAGEPDSYITSAFSDELKKVKPAKIKAGKFYVRQKFEDPYDPDAISYQIYEGQPTGSIGTLSKFELPKGLSYSNFVKKKFYLNKGAEFDEDLEKVYFDGKNAFIEGDQNVYIKHNGSFIALTYLDEKICYIEISSEPSGATVLVGSDKKGVTPIKFSVVGTKPVTVTLKKEGFYSVDKVIKPNPTKVIQDGVLMVKEKEMIDPSKPLSAKLLALEEKPNYDSLKLLSREINETLESLTTLVRKSKAEVKNRYPKNAPKKSSETDAQFARRTKTWEQGLKNELASQDENAIKVKEKLKKLLKKSNKMKDEFRKIEQEREAKEAAAKEKERYTLKYQGLSSEYIILGDYRRGVFNYDLTIDKKPFQFTYKGKFRKAKLDKNEIIDNDYNLSAVVTYWNVKTEDGYFKSLRDVDIFYKKKELPSPRNRKGTLSFKQKDVKASTIAKKYNARFNKELRNKKARRAFSKEHKKNIDIALENLDIFPEVELSIAQKALKAAESDVQDTASIKAQSDTLIASESTKTKQKDDFKESFDAMDDLYTDSKVPFYTAIALAAVSVGTGVYAIILNGDATGFMNEHAEAIQIYNNATAEELRDPATRHTLPDGRLVSNSGLTTHINNKTIQYNTALTQTKIFGAIAGLSLVGSVVLFTF